MLVTINFLRPGKGITRYIEGFVEENPVRLKTFTSLSSDFSLKWCEELWWQNGFIPEEFWLARLPSIYSTRNGFP